MLFLPRICTRFCFCNTQKLMLVLGFLADVIYYNMQTIESI